MKTALLSLFAVAAIPLFAREEALPDSTSPDKRYYITVEEADGRISYQLKGAAERAILLSIPSTYQPDNDSDDWAFRQSLGATINWRKDSRCVAIDEANHGRIGTVLLAFRKSKGFQRVPMSSEKFTRASKLPWERGRLFFGEWGPKDTVTVGLIGLVWADPPSTPPAQRHRNEASCGFTVALPSGKLLSITPETDETK